MNRSLKAKADIKARGDRQASAVFRYNYSTNNAESRRTIGTDPIIMSVLLVVVTS
jgi:hypothetical protein